MNISFAEEPSMMRKVVMLEHHAAHHTGKTLRVELLDALSFRTGCFEVLAFDTMSATSTEGPVKGVVMLCTIWLVSKDVEICRCKGIVTSGAREAFFVVAACKASVGAGHRLLICSDNL
jgi:hypothetical protein